MSEEQSWIEWSPSWAPHVKGRYTERVAGEGGMPEPQIVEAVCEACKTKWGPRECISGSVRTHITRFAHVHLHRDPLAVPIPGREGPAGTTR